MADETALERLRSDLRRAFDLPKCKKCGCMRATLEDLREETADLTGDEADTLRSDLDEFLAGLEPTEYSCLGCDPCLPPEAQNRFHAAWTLPLRPTRGSSLCCQTASTDGWPVEPGDYTVVDASAPVAVCTLASADLANRLAQLSPSGLAIVGKLETENIGIDKIVRNTVTNSSLRFLLVVGEEPRGHLSGSTLLALSANGIDGEGRIVGAPGTRPFLRNVSPDEIKRFRDQVQVIDLIGLVDADKIAAEVEARAGEVQAVEDSCCCHECRPASQPLPPSVQHIHAAASQRFRMDPEGYFVILPQAETRSITVEHYDYDHRLRHVIEGENAHAICSTIVELGLATRLEHAAYLGRELERAELSLRLGLPFVQDGA